MAISAFGAVRTSVLSGISGRSSYCATCGQAGSVLSRAYSGGYSGRSGSDTYVCATCGKTGSTQTNNAPRIGTTYGSTSCATCGSGNRSGYSSSWTGGSSSSASSGGKIYGTTAWAR